QLDRQHVGRQLLQLGVAFAIERIATEGEPVLRDRLQLARPPEQGCRVRARTHDRDPGRPARRVANTWMTSACASMRGTVCGAAGPLMTGASRPKRLEVADQRVAKRAG